jgi:hypothetical protein
MLKGGSLNGTPDAFVVVVHPIKKRGRPRGFAIQAPAGTLWAIGPNRTFGWYLNKHEAVDRCLALNHARAFEPASLVFPPKGRDFL